MDASGWLVPFHAVGVLPGSGGRAASTTVSSYGRARSMLMGAEGPVVVSSGLTGRSASPGGAPPSGT
ncbi:hypothetical protein C1J01_44355 [Nonomuraea aridisoli]|uniref:Uncharacterized protein n=1 Tax=Nonomuraea aridisoli TaxID=2070368 RepID=A0A2W2D1N7_9ACTN|nr:hypothetical protein C1J01_44355 [Nonomuraea aridisoli]